MLILAGTAQSLEIDAGVAGSVDYDITFVDILATPDISPGESNGNVTTSGVSSVCAAPAVATTERQIKHISLINRASVAQTVRVRKNISGIIRYLSPKFSLGPDDMAEYSQEYGWRVIGASGGIRTNDAMARGFSGYPLTYFKVGTAAEAAGQWYSWAKDSGNPGAWAPGTPGMAGRATDGTAAADAGCLPVKNAASGANFLTKYWATSTVAAALCLMDVLWVNSGAVVTTLTAQTVNSVAFPARDLLGTVNGEGCWVGILVTTATTNGAAITNITLSYTNSSGVAGRTATMASFPATAVVGTVVWFQLQAGDDGIQSIQSITLGTSLVTGAISLIVARLYQVSPAALVNVGGVAQISADPGERLYNGACLLPVGIASATTAATITGQVVIMER